MKQRLTAVERKALFHVFAKYRAYKAAIATQTVPAMRGFASAIHPDLIRVGPVHAGGPTIPSGFAMSPGFNDAAFKKYIWRIDWHVRKLKPYQRAIIRMRFLGADPLPKDQEVYKALYQDGWYVGKTFYESEKRTAFGQLWASLQTYGLEFDKAPK